MGMISRTLGIIREYTDRLRYIEGVVRGYRNNLLTGQNYGNLTQCETIDGRDSFHLSELD